MDDSLFAPIPYPGSFQRGQIFRTGDPLAAAWRHIERFGTVESLTRVATGKKVDPAFARTASLRVRQAIELRIASREGSLLTRPLTLYYSALNLTRAVLLAYFGDIGGASHGLKYHAGPNLLECSAEVTKKGTFGGFAKSLDKSFAAGLEGKRLSLRDLMAVIPEVRQDFSLLQAGHSSIAYVRVQAFMRGEMRLIFSVEGLTLDDFNSKWSDYFHWLKDVCELVIDSPFTLRVKQAPKDLAEIEAFCGKFLIAPLHRRENPAWFDHIERGGSVVLMPRLLAYLGVLFILSNVSRYEPERLAEPTRELTDVGYVLSTLLDHSERYFPQLVLELVYRTPVFFE